MRAKLKDNRLILIKNANGNFSMPKSRQMNRQFKTVVNSRIEKESTVNFGDTGTDTQNNMGL